MDNHFEEKFDESNDYDPPSLDRGSQPHDAFRPTAWRGMEVDIMSNPLQMNMQTTFKSFGSTEIGSQQGHFFSKEKESVSFGLVHDQLESFPSEEQPPLALGGYLEPFYHFYSTSQPSYIMTVLDRLLSSFKRDHDFTIDFEVKAAHKYKIKCDYYSRSSRIPFVIRIFSLENQPSRYAVEFQRRSGDAMAFGALYRECLKSLEQQGIAEPEDNSEFSSWFADSPAPPVDSNQFEPEHADQSIEILLEMAKGEYLDVQIEALNTLALMGHEQSMHQVLLKHGVFEALLQLLKSSCEDVHRCSLTCLADLATPLSAKEKIAEIVSTPDFLAPLLDLTGSKCLQVVRESARLLKNMIEKAPTSFEGSADVIAAVHRNLELCSDSVARDYGDEILTMTGSL